jgi:hypothetical protein
MLFKTFERTTRHETGETTHFFLLYPNTVISLANEASRQTLMASVVRFETTLTEFGVSEETTDIRNDIKMKTIRIRLGVI